MRGRGGSGAQVGGDRRKRPRPSLTPSGLRGAPQWGLGPPAPGSEGLLPSPDPTLRGWAQARTGCPPQLPGRAGDAWVCFIHFPNRKEGCTHSLWRTDPQHLDCGCPQKIWIVGRPPGVHRPTQRRPPKPGVTSGNSNSPSSSPSSLLIWGVMFQQGSPAARSGPASREVAAGGRGAPGLGARIRRGRARRLPRPR